MTRAGTGRSLLLSRRFLGAAFVNFFATSNFFLLVPITVLLVHHRYDAPLSVGGLVAGALLAGGVVARPLAGPALHALPARALLVLTMSTMTLATAACLLPVGLTVFTLLRFVSGLAFGITSTATLAVAVAGLPSERRGSGTGWFGLSNSLAGAIGPAIGLFVANRWGYDTVIAAVVGLGMLGCVAAALLPRQPRPAPGPESRSSGLRRFLEPAALPLCVFIACAGITYSSIYGYLDAWSVSQGLTAWAPWFFVCYSTMVVLSRPITGRLMDSTPPAVVMLPALATVSLGLVLLALMDSAGLMVAAGLVCGAGMGTVLCSATVLAVRIAPPGRIAVTASTFYLALDGGVALGPPLLGLALPYWGYPGLFTAMAILVALVAALFLALDRRSLFAPR